MPSTNAKFSEIDNELAQFARLLALPVRVYIIRTIIENGNVISKKDICNVPFEMENILKHLAELKSLGVIKINGTKANITYSINSNVFDQILIKFSSLFNNLGSADYFHTLPGKQQDNELSHANGETESVKYANFGMFIKKHRVELHISQEELARKMNIDRAELSRIECGKKNLNADKLEALSKVLYIDINSLTREYYSYRIVDLVEKSGFKNTVLESAINKVNYLTSFP